MTGAAPKLRVSPAEFTHCPNPAWAAVNELVERFGDAMSALALSLHEPPPEMFDADVTQVELVGAMVKLLHQDLVSGTRIEAHAMAMLCACIWNRQPEQGVRRG